MVPSLRYFETYFTDLQCIDRSQQSGWSMKGISLWLPWKIYRGFWLSSLTYFLVRRCTLKGDESVPSSDTEDWPLVYCDIWCYRSFTYMRSLGDNFTHLLTPQAWMSNTSLQIQDLAVTTHVNCVGGIILWISILSFVNENNNTYAWIVLMFSVT